MDIVRQDVQLIATHYIAHSKAGEYVGEPHMNGWTKGLGALVGSTAFCWIVFSQTENHTRATVPIPGWDDLLYCADVASLDGTKRVTFSENHSLYFHDDNSADDRRNDTWSFDEKLKRYTVTLKGQDTIYSLISPKDANTCMLIKGDIEAADLRGSWFASFPDNDDPRESDPHDR
jgi:hypothetical protein